MRTTKAERAATEGADWGGTGLRCGRWSLAGSVPSVAAASSGT